MKLLLIRETSSLYKYSNTSYGLGIIGTIAKDVADVRILDNNSLHKFYTIKDILKVIRAYDPDIIGFNIHSFNIFNSSKLIPAVAKEFPDICLIAGGLHTYSEPYEVSDLGVNIVVKDDAELTILPLLRELKPFVKQSPAPFRVSKELAQKLRLIPGLLFSEVGKNELDDTGTPNQIEELDKIPFVDYDLFNLNDYLKGPGDYHFVTNVIITQRGCPFRCPFCHGRWNGELTKVRENSIKYKIDYIRYLLEKHKQNHIVFYDNNFTLRKTDTIALCKEIVRSGLHKEVTFSCQTNVAISLDDELLRAMKDANFNQVGLGVERLSKESLALIKKNRNYKTIINNIHLLNKYEIGVLANCLIGFPFETVETVKEEMHLFKSLLENIEVFSINNLLPTPGTEIYKDTRYKRWYLDPKCISWKPSFYHMVYNYTNNAWDKNYFDLNIETQNAIRGMKEYFYGITIRKMKSRFIGTLYLFEKCLAGFSYKLYQLSPAIESIIFFILKKIRLQLRNYFITKYYVKRS